MSNKPLPQFVAPMAAASVKEPFDSPDWIFEPKLDGYRAITVIDSTGKAQLWSRNHLPLEPKFPTIRDAINQLMRNGRKTSSCAKQCFSDGVMTKAQRT